MTSRNACLLVMALMCLAAVHLQAQTKVENPWDSGNAFLRLCHAMDKPAEEMTDTEVSRGNRCISYLVGIEDGIWLQADLSRGPGHAELLAYCVDPKVEHLQPARILLKYIRDNPAKAHLRTVELYGLAMKEAFPCPAIK